ncbi:MAG: hypothetical protein JWP61_856 [Friedmanniella sp.]|nr:hypothetical protein [Friedmanniella sp.]
MDGWSIGLVVLIAVGLAAIVYGALSDRAMNRRRAAAMLAPPERTIPQFQPTGAGPRYVSELQARRPPPGAPTTLSEADRSAIGAALKDPGTPSFPAGWVSADFVTDPPTSWAVLDQPVVLVCGDEVASLRELLPVLERALASRTALVVVAPELGREVQSTLEVNAIRRTLPLLAVRLPDAAARDRLAAACGATVTDRGDRQAGYVLPEQLGTCGRWVATRTTSHLLSPQEHLA